MYPTLQTTHLARFAVSDAVRIFLAQIPIIALGLVGISVTLPARPQLHGWQQQLRRVDFLGALTVALTITALLLGLDRGVHGSWRSPLTITLLSAFPFLLGAFLWIERSFATEPLAPWRVLSARSLLACFLTSFFEYGALMALEFNLPLFWRAVMGLSSARVGLLLLPLALGSLAPLAGGAIMRATGRYYALHLSALALCAVSVVPVMLSTGTPWYSQAGAAV